MKAPLTSCFALMTMMLAVGCAAPADANETDKDALVASKPVASSWARLHNDHCMRKHLEESLELNRARRAGYERLSDGRSTLTSSTMIGMDHIGLAFADEIDEAGRGIDGRSGVNIVCELVPSLADASAMPTTRLRPLPADSYKPLPLPKIRAELRALSDERRWLALEQRATELAEATADEARYNCFSRQALRTIARLAHVVREHDTPQAEAFAARAMSVMLPMTRSSALVDRMAARAQRDGTPILCADMPTVPSF